MRLSLVILFNLIVACSLSAQGVTKTGRSTTTGDYFINKNGRTVDIPSLSRFGSELFAPSLTTAAVTSITSSSATSGGNISSNTGEINSRGVCWATSANPTTANHRTNNGSGSGSFTSQLSGLSAGTTYYVRAYAVTESGTLYGNQLIFRTLSQGYETLSSAIYNEAPNEVRDITIGNVRFTKVVEGPVNCGSANSFRAKTIEDAYAIVGSDASIDYRLANPELRRFVEDGRNCEVFDMSGRYIYYGHSRAFYRVDKNTFGNKVRFDISGIWEGGTDFNVSACNISGVNEMPDLGLLIQVDNKPSHFNIYKVPYIAQSSGNFTYTRQHANLVMDIPYWNPILTKAWGLSIKGNTVFAVIYNSRGYAYLSNDSGNSFRCVFSMADISINSTVSPDEMVFVDTKPDGHGGYGAVGGHPMSNTLTNPQNFDLWGITPNGSLHAHGGCIDTYADRLVIVTGDSYPAVGIFYSDDWGYNWTFIPTGVHMPSADCRTQFVTAIPMEDCILFGNDGLGDGYWRVFRNGGGLLSTIECCYQYTGSNTQLVTINGGQCSLPDGTMLGLINPHESINYTTTRGGIVATRNGHNFKKLFEDPYTRFTYETAEFGRRGLITVNDNNKVLVKAKNGGLIILDLISE
ncbi:MAG: hypothetical protein WAW07_01880 [Bacteroidales bacterium]